LVNKSVKKLLTHRFWFDIVASQKHKFPSFNSQQGKETLVKSILDKAPFSFLPENAREELLTHLSSETIKKDAILLAQEISVVEELLFLSEGAAQYYFEQNN
jgi:hypothetical protein